MSRIGERQAKPEPGPRIHALSGADRRRGRSTPIDDDFVRRIEDYAVKAAREGKLETSWLDPDEDYERGLRDFVRAILDRGRSGPFLDSFDGFARRTALLGALNSLTQLVLKATMPGVPDFYQGTETWDLSLVDPDNRRPVDFAARQAALAAASEPDWAALASQLDRRPHQARAHPSAVVAAQRDCRRYFATAPTSRSR